VNILYSILKNLGYGAPPRHETRAFSESRNEREPADDCVY
jgi:hypothetical protein